MLRTVKPFQLFIALLILAVTNVNCVKTVENQQGETAVPSKTIQEVLKEHTKTLMDIPGVVGVGQGLTDDDRDCIKVFVASMTPEVKQQVPKTLNGYPVQIEVTGEFKALDKD
jgi:hypothetical protein